MTTIPRWGLPVSASNFGFLGQHDERVARLGLLAERYFRDDPPTSIVKLRQLAELLAKLIAARHATYRDERETLRKRCAAYPTSA